MKKLIACGVILVCSVHAVATLIFLSPTNLVKNSANSIVNAYMAPLFYQDWHLFSPNPGISSSHFWVRCQSEKGEWSSWIDPFQKLQEEHYSNRMTGRGKLLYVYNGIARHLDDSFGWWRRECIKGNIKNAKDGAQLQATCSARAVETDVPKYAEYKLASRFSTDFCLGLRPVFGSVTSVQFKTVTLYPTKYSERETAKKWDYVDEKLYPASPIFITLN